MFRTDLRPDYTFSSCHTYSTPPTPYKPRAPVLMEKPVCTVHRPTYDGCWKLLSTPPVSVPTYPFEFVGPVLIEASQLSWHLPQSLSPLSLCLSMDQISEPLHLKGALSFYLFLALMFSFWLTVWLKHFPPNYVYDVLSTEQITWFISMWCCKMYSILPQFPATVKTALKFFLLQL